MLYVLLLFTILTAPFSAIAATSSTKKSASHSKIASPKRSKNKAVRKKPVLSKKELARMRRMNHAFVASSTLRPMAKQLLDARTKAAYAGVEAYAKKHAGTDEAAMANLVLGYAHILDREYPQALPHLKKAEAKAGDLADYVAYYMAVANNGAGNTEAAIAALDDFQTKYSDSILARDAAVLYVNLLLTSGDAKKSIAVAQKYRTPTRSDIELSLGRAYMKLGESAKAIETLRHLYYTMPMSGEADSAAADLSSLGGLSGTFVERKTRADLLAKGRRYREAAKEYADLVSMATTQNQKDDLQVAKAIAEYRSGDSRDAQQTLEALSVSGEANAQRMYFLADIARSGGDEGRFNDIVNQMRQAVPSSGWFESTLLSAGNMYLLKKDYDRAIDFYRELDERFPTGKNGHYAHWKAAWLSLRQGRTEEAAKGFESQIAKYADTAEVPAALYWRGRLAEEGKDIALARAYYNKITSRFKNYYYADRARERMKAIGQGVATKVVLLDHIPPVSVPNSLIGETPDDNLRVQKSRLLENCALFDFAVKELQKASAGDSDPDWTAAEIARLYQEGGAYHRALRYMKSTVPSYFALDYSALPRTYWETLFPRPFWTDLRRYSTANNLDPYLVASLIRQESEFNPGAISRANALGLMQVLPVTGTKLARDLKLHRFRPEQLLLPNTNLQLGTRYFKDLLNHFNGTPEYALAAYNAGSNRVDDWLAEGNYRDSAEFVESIPFTETREYVQAIMRNATVYKNLYSGGPSAN